MPCEYLPGMTTSLDAPSSRGRLYAALAAGIVFLILAGVGIYGLVTGPKTPPPSAPPATSNPSTSPGSGTQSPRVTEPPRVVGSTDPDQFARNVATTLFAWDTASGLMPLDYSAAILAVGDPSGTEQAGLASDVANYLPSRDQWVELRKHATSQTLTIERTYVPEAWADAVGQAPPGQVPTGASAVTIEGTRHRAGTWNGTPVTDDFQVAFTIFIACPAKADSCHALRLSQLDNPLK